MILLSSHKQLQHSIIVTDTYFNTLTNCRMQCFAIHIWQEKCNYWHKCEK